ncbi:MAG: family 1 encapsulin nanocompartment shell protein [Bacteroidales bacterium]|nr:family 1 encapsulin nanocompartment shell protein [Bacteroidales bacterium]
MKREQLTEWTDKEWSNIDNAVKEEVNRLSLTRKFIPEQLNVAKDATTINANKITLKAKIGNIDETQTIKFSEKSENFQLTRRQIESESVNGVAKSLAIKHAKSISREEDKEILNQIITDSIIDPIKIGRTEKEQENAKQIINGVRAAIKKLQEKLHDGPYALILNTDSFYEINCPVDNSFTTAADRLDPTLEKGIFHAPTLNSENKKGSPDLGILISLGGKTMDIARSINPITEYQQCDADDNFIFRIYQRFAFRLMQPDSVVPLLFVK